MCPVLEARRCVGHPGCTRAESSPCLCEQVWEYGTCLAEMEHACELAAMPPVTAKALPVTDGAAEMARSDLYALHADCFPEHLLVRSAAARCACCACCAACCAQGACVPIGPSTGLWHCGATPLMAAAPRHRLRVRPRQHWQLARALIARVWMNGFWYGLILWLGYKVSHPAIHLCR